MKFTLNTAMFMLLVAAHSSAAHAQDTAAPSRDVTTETSAGRHDYCLGLVGGLPFMQERDPDDISLRLSLNERYENHLSETVILPMFNRRIHAFRVAGESEVTIVRDSRSGVNLEAVMAMSVPDGSFSMLAVGKEEPVFDSLVDSPSQTVIIPVLHRSAGLDLRGKTVEIIVTRDYESLPPDVVETLNETWADHGTVWVGTVQSTLTIQIPTEPITWDLPCTDPPPSLQP